MAQPFGLLEEIFTISGGSIYDYVWQSSASGNALPAV
jgi:hypothetical protein